jgi:hypothetical protein
MDDLEAALALLPGSQIVAIGDEGREAVMDPDGVFRHNESLRQPRIVMRWNGRERILFGPNKRWWDEHGSPRTNIYGGVPTMVHDLAKAIYTAVEQGRFSR